MDWTIIWRDVRFHPVTWLVCVLGVAVGVGAWVGMQTAATQAISAFEDSVTATVGRATHVVEPASGPLDESVWEQLVSRTDEPISPVIEGTARWNREDGSVETLRIVGMDPVTYPVFQPMGETGESLPLDRFLSGESVVFAGGGIPSRSALRIQVPAGEREVEVVGRVSEETGGRVLYMDVNLAQRLLNRTGELDRILIRTEDPARHERVLPEGVYLLETGQRMASTRSLVESFRWNLYALGFLALFVGAFLVYSSMLVITTRQRSTHSLLRTLGMDGRRVLKLVFLQVLVLGGLGTLLGLVGGLLAAGPLGHLVSGTVDQLFTPLWASGEVVRPEVLVVGFVMGLIVTIAGGIGPVLGVRSLPPRAWERSGEEAGDGVPGIWVQILGVVGCVGGSAGLIRATSTSLLAGFTACFLLALGGAFLSGPLLELLRIIPWRGMWERMASRNLVRLGGRILVVTMTLTVAFSMLLSVSLMVGSFRTSVRDWVNTVIAADVYVSAAEQRGLSGGEGVSESFLDRLRQRLPEATVVVQRETTVQTPEGAPLTVTGMEVGPVREQGMLRVRQSSPNAWERLREDGVFVSEPGAYRLSLEPGDRLTIPLTGQPDDVRTVVGIVEGYSTDWAQVYVDQAWMASWDRPVPITDLAVFSEDPVEDRLRSLAGEFGYSVRSNRELRNRALEEFDRTFAVTDIMRVIAVLVAVIGLIATMIALNQNRLDQFGTLSAGGASRWHLVRLMGGETAGMTVVALLAALPTGMGLCWLLLHVINRRSFGWTIGMDLTVGSFLELTVAAGVAWILAMAVPAWTVLTTPLRSLLGEVGRP